jgi:hypothetical protein
MNSQLPRIIAILERDGQIDDQKPTKRRGQEILTAKLPWGDGHFRDITSGGKRAAFTK